MATYEQHVLHGIDLLRLAQIRFREAQLYRHQDQACADIAYDLDILKRKAQALVAGEG